MPSGSRGQYLSLIYIQGVRDDEMALPDVEVGFQYVSMGSIGPSRWTRQGRRLATALDAELDSCMEMVGCDIVSKSNASSDKQKSDN